MVFVQQKKRQSPMTQDFRSMAEKTMWGLKLNRFIFELVFCGRMYNLMILSMSWLFCGIHERKILATL